jgi:hypothetical protein
MSTDVPEEYVASILRVEEQAKQKPITKQLASLLSCRHSVFYLLHAGILLGSFFDPEDVGDMFFRNVG